MYVIAYSLLERVNILFLDLRLRDRDILCPNSEYIYSYKL